MPEQIKQNSTTLIFDLREFAPLGEENHVLLCLNENTYHIVLNLFSFYGNWLNRYSPNTDGETWYKVEGEDAIFVHDMFDKGMGELQVTVCFDDFIKVQRMMVAAIVGEAVDLTEPLPDNVDYTATGLANRLGPNVAADSAQTVKDAIDQLRGSVELLTAAIAASEGVNTDLEPVLNAIEDILGGSWEPEG